MDILGIDIGGSGIKGAPVDVTTGTLTKERFKVLTPHPALPGRGRRGGARRGGRVRLVRAGRHHLSGVVTGGVIRTAANLDPAWVGVDARALFAAATGLATSRCSTTPTRPARRR